MKVIERNVFCGSIKPEEIIITPCSITHNYGIKSQVVEDFESHKKYMVYTIDESVTEFNESFVNALAATSVEHDELIAEIIEGNQK